MSIAALFGPGFPAGQVPGVHDAFALDLDVAALFEQEAVLEPFVDVLRDLNVALLVSGHPCGRRR